MDDSDVVEQATSRLAVAIGALEEAVSRQIEQGRSSEDLRERVRALTAENERLAADLDAECQRAARLESINDDATNRLDSLISSVKASLQAR